MISTLFFLSVYVCLINFTIFLYCNLSSIIADHFVAFGYNSSSLDAFSKTFYFEEASHRGTIIVYLPFIYFIVLV